MFHMFNLFSKLVLKFQLNMFCDLLNGNLICVNTNNIFKIFSQFIVDYCKNDTEARNQVSVELVVCEDMVKLLPLKLESLQREMPEQES